MYYEARDETGPSSYEPQVIIKGGPNHNILMTHHILAIQLGQLTRHEIDMTEVAKFLPSELFQKLLPLPNVHFKKQSCLLFKNEEAFGAV